jgi:lipid-A-disaccharide synthase
MVLTGEPSGDMHAGRLAAQLNLLGTNLYISGIGGPSLRAQGADLFYDISRLSAMGITEVIGQLGSIRQAFAFFKQKLAERRCDLLIVVDYPGFNLKAAQYAKRYYGCPVLYYITPKVWAWKKSRLKQMRTCIDHAAVILPFEQKIYKTARIAATYVGNPLMDEYPEHLTRPFLKRSQADEKNDITIGLLPGSRKSEIDRLLGTMKAAADRIHRQIPNTRFIISRAGSVCESYFNAKLTQAGGQKDYSVFTGPVKDLFQQVDLVIAASGTVTLEAALCCVPTILIYKMSGISYRIGRILVDLDYVGLSNLIVRKEVMPELLQDEATPEKIVQKALAMLDNLEYHEEQLSMVRKFLGVKGASRKTAAIALQMIRQ